MELDCQNTRITTAIKPPCSLISLFPTLCTAHRRIPYKHYTSSSCHLLASGTSRVWRVRKPEHPEKTPGQSGWEKLKLSPHVFLLKLRRFFRTLSAPKCKTTCGSNARPPGFPLLKRRPKGKHKRTNKKTKRKSKRVINKQTKEKHSAHFLDNAIVTFIVKVKEVYNLQRSGLIA